MDSNKNQLPSTPPSSPLSTTAMDSSSRDLPLKDWVAFYFEHSKRFSDILQDELNIIERRCVYPDLSKLEDNNKRSEIIAVELVRQIHFTIKKHIVGLQIFDKGMCREFAERYPVPGNEFKEQLATDLVDPSMPTTDDADKENLVSSEKKDSDLCKTGNNIISDGETPNTKLNEIAGPSSSNQALGTMHTKSVLSEQAKLLDNDLSLVKNFKTDLSDESKLSLISCKFEKETRNENKLSISEEESRKVVLLDSEEDEDAASVSFKVPAIKDKHIPIEQVKVNTPTGEEEALHSEAELIQNCPKLQAEAQVKLTRLNRACEDELEQHSFIRTEGSFSDGDEDDERLKKILRDLNRKINVLSKDQACPTCSDMSKSKISGSSTSKKRKKSKSRLGYSSTESELESDEIDEHRELPTGSSSAYHADKDEICNTPDSNEAATPESFLTDYETCDDSSPIDFDELDEESGRNCILSSEDENKESNFSGSTTKERNDNQNNSETDSKLKKKIMMPYIGNPLKLSDLSDTKQSSTQQKVLVEKQNLVSSTTETEDVENKFSKERSVKKNIESGNDNQPALANSLKTSIPQSSASSKSEKKPEQQIVLDNSNFNQSSSANPVLKKTFGTHSPPKRDLLDKEPPLQSDYQNLPKKPKLSDVTSHKVTKQRIRTPVNANAKMDPKKVGESRKTELANKHELANQKERKPRIINADSDSSSSFGSDSSSSDDDEVKIVEHSKSTSVSSSKGRKNIRKVLAENELKSSTRDALKDEEGRKERIIQKKKLYDEIFASPPSSSQVNPLVLDFDADAKKPLISVHPNIAAKLKPHQAAGIQFMWDSCFESVKDLKEGGCILAHCMGLGKTLQVVALVHTVLSHNRLTQVKRVLIICPLSMVENCCQELRLWTKETEKEISPYRLWEPRKQGRFDALLEWYKNGGVGVLHYEAFRRSLGAITEQTTDIDKQARKNIKIVQRALIDGPDLVICDEGHLLKNANSQISVAVNKIATKRRIVLTGTPLQNNLTEYHTMMSFVKPNLLGDIKEFRNRFANPILNGQHKDSVASDVQLMKKKAHILHKLLEGCVQRLDFNVLLPYLPKKYEYAISVNLTEKQKDLYEYYLNSFTGTKSNNARALMTSQVFTDFYVLNKICTHPRVLTFNKSKATTSNQISAIVSSFSLEDASNLVGNDISVVNRDSDIDDVDWLDNSGNTLEKNKTSYCDAAAGTNVSTNPTAIDGKEFDDDKWFMNFFKDLDDIKMLEHSGKLQVLIEILKVCENDGDKVLIFSQFLTTLDLIETVLAELDKEAVRKAGSEDLFGFPDKGRYRQGVDYFRIDGTTKISIRQDQCDQFNKSLNKAKVFLISTRAGSLGINLTGANRVVIFDASWNPSADLQAIFRIYRFGQTKPCYVYRLLCRGTMEEKVYNRQVVKLSLSCRVVDEQQIERHTTYEDLKNMYQFDRNNPTDKPTPIVPKDKLLAGILQSHGDLIFSYLEHDSLLENKEEEELSEEQKRLAWHEYNLEEENRRRLQRQTPLNTPRGQPTISLEHMHELYLKNVTYFKGAPNWVINTMWRIHCMHGMNDLSMLGQRVRNIEKQIDSLIDGYNQVSTGNCLPYKLMEARNKYTSELHAFRQQFNGFPEQNDIVMYCENIPVGLVADVLNRNFQGPGPSGQTKRRLKK